MAVDRWCGTGESEEDEWRGMEIVFIGVLVENHSYLYELVCRSR